MSVKTKVKRCNNDYCLEYQKGEVPEGKIREKE